MHCMLNKKSADDIMIFFLFFFSENRLRYFIQIVETFCMECQDYFKIVLLIRLLLN